MIKVIASLLLVFAAAWAINTYRTSMPDEEALKDQAAQKQTATAAEQEAQDAMLQADRDLAERRARLLAGSTTHLGSQIYKCEGPQGSELQSEPCGPNAKTAWVRQAGEHQDRNSYAREAFIAQKEAEVSSYTQMYGDNANPSYTVPNQQASALDQNLHACQAAKDYREAVLKRVGMNRNFDLLRNLNDRVYEACKGT